MRRLTEVTFAAAAFAVVAALVAGATRQSDTSGPATSPPVATADVVASGSPTPVTTAPVRPLPPVTGRFDYQLGGPSSLPPGVTTVVRDRTAAPVRGAYSVCYVNAFQTQPQELDWWRTRHAALLLRDARGRLVTDPDWPDEVLLDTATDAKRRAVAAIVGVWTDGCARVGYRAVELDNLDSFSRSGGRLSAAGNLTLARALAVRAHARGLAVAQKNAAELAPMGRRTGFDFAVAEECQVYAECAAYARAYGRAVLEVEYTDNGRAAFRAACVDRSRRGPVVLRDRELAASGPSRSYAAC